jgi:signal transduction histidine kinase
MARLPKTAAHVVLLATVYVAFAKVGLSLDAVAGFATLVWAPTGIALVAVLLLGPRMWPGIALGALVANLWAGALAPVALGIAAGNTLEALLGAYLVRRALGSVPSLERVRDVVAWVVLGAFVAPIASASIGIGSLVAGGMLPVDRVAETLRAWWVGDALGALVVGSLLLAWRARPVSSDRGVEALLLGVVLCALTLLVFLRAPNDLSSPFRTPYVLFPVLVCIALRLGVRGAVVATFLVSAIAIWATARGTGPFARTALSEGLTFLQTFMAVVATTMLILAAAITERERAVRLRDEQLAVVSHDLRNPLNTISLRVEQLRKAPHMQEDQRARAVEQIHRSVERMARLIKDLLDRAAIEAGSLSIDRAPQPVGALAREAAEVMRPLALERGQTLTVELPPDDIRVECDRDRTLQVLWNLLGNAIKFTPEGGAIAIRVEAFPFAAKLAVSDDGPGIDADEIRHVFERFWRGRAAGTKKGAGLGLAIAKGIVEAQGGSIWAESIPGRGSTFTFTVPRARAE